MRLLPGPRTAAPAGATGSPSGPRRSAPLRWRDAGAALLPLLLIAGVLADQRWRTGRLDPVVLVLAGSAGCLLALGYCQVLRALRGHTDELARQAARYRELAYTDPLTGLANRRGLRAALDRQANHGTPYALLSLDLDGFKSVNDRYGHDAGDTVLVEVARRLRSNLRPDDVAARFGGDEFVVLMSASLPEAQRVAERLTGVLGRPYPHAGGHARLSVSIGVAAGAGDDPGTGGLHRADLALCHAKRRGKNRVECYDEAYDELLRRRLRLERELPGAIGRGELRLAYHPVVAVPRLRPVGAEAVPRWVHPELGDIRAAEFLPLAQESGVSAELGSWALHEAGRQLSRWLAQGHDVCVSVGVLPRQLHDPEYALLVADVLHTYRIPPHRLVLELTDRPATPDLDELIRRLGALRRTGVRIALAGYGADTSCLVWLRRLPIDVLKVHDSLLGTPEPVDSSGAPLLDLLGQLGDRLGLTVIAQGVRGADELTAVTAAGCRYGQGVLFGWGMPAARFTELLCVGYPTGVRSAPPAGGPSICLPTATCPGSETV